jgi:hypothetical protein|tara:strand:- start:3442 stop:4062 length:621 start_codon:yes stop_codon:yes gene_type:complete
MWASKRINYMLSCMIEDDRVGEIIIIDNNPKERILRVNSPKIIILEQKENIFVNPAWNLGVKNAKNENICIANDDILFDNIDVLDFVEKHIDKGVIGMNTANYYPDVIGDGNYQIIKNDYDGTARNWGWGCLFFIKKSNWSKIPDDLKIGCGDDYLLSRVKGNGWSVRNMFLYTDKVSVTSNKPEFLSIQEIDIETYKGKYDIKKQ